MRGMHHRNLQGTPQHAVKLVSSELVADCSLEIIVLINLSRLANAIQNAVNLLCRKKRTIKTKKTETKEIEKCGT